MKKIKEEDGEHKAWYEVKPQTPEELAAFIYHLTEDYQHDYGTICHAVAAAAVAAARTVDASSQGGITGFQASAVMWEFIRAWMHLEGPARFLNYDRMLYPQYKHEFDQVISRKTMDWLQEQAKKRLLEAGPIDNRVWEHLNSIVNDIPPFGFSVREED